MKNEMNKSGQAFDGSVETPRDLLGVERLLASDGAAMRGEMPATLDAKLRSMGGGGSLRLSDLKLLQDSAVSVSPMPRMVREVQTSGGGMRFLRAAAWVGALAAAVALAFVAKSMIGPVSAPQGNAGQIASSGSSHAAGPGVDAVATKSVAPLSEAALFDVAFDDSDRVEFELLRSEAVDLQDRLDGAVADTDWAGAVEASSVR